MSQYPQSPLPYQSVPVLPPRRPTSVTVIAIFVIVLASLGLICSPFSLLPFLSTDFRGKDPVSAAMYDNKALQTSTIIFTLVGFFLQLVNLIAAISALKLQPWARRVMLKLAGIQIVLNIAGTAINLSILVPALKELSKTEPSATAGLIGGIIGGGMGLIIGCVLPICVLVFFRKQHVIDAFEAPPLATAGPLPFPPP